MMKNRYVLEQNTRTLLKSNHLLIDTNVIIDASNFPEEFLELLQDFKSLDCIPCCTNLIRVEYLGGTRSQDNLNEKIKFLDQVAATIPMTWENSNSVGFNKLLLDFSRQAKSFSFVDFSLALTLEKYQNSGLLLMTRNHTDFTDKLFDRRGYITLFGNTDIKTYGIYSLKKAG